MSASKRLYPDVLTFYVGGIGGAEHLGRRPRHGRVVFPRVFSFIESPDEALDALNAVVRLGTAQRDPAIAVHQQACQVVDLCANAVLSAFAQALPQHPSQQAWRGRVRIRWSGRWPHDPQAAEILAATGLQKELDVPLPADLRHFDYLGLIEGRFAGARSGAGSADHTATQLVAYLDRCLGRYGYVLSAEGRERFGELIAEVLNNSEDHSGRAEWWTSAYLRQPAGASYGDCHLTIFNFGRTVAESMQRLPATAKLRRDIERLLVEHEAGGHFRGGFTHEAAWTRCALQPRVSCMNDGVTDVYDRGQGTVRLMEAFYRLGQTRDRAERPRMALVSGHTHIVFDDSPMCRLQTLPRVGAEDHAIVAFNDRNSMRLPPSPLHVKNLRNRFPGVMLSLRFYLDPAHLENVDEYVARTG